MTTSELRSLRYGEHVSPSKPLVCYGPVQVAPLDDSTIVRNEPVRPMTQKDYNRVSLTDVPVFQGVRRMDTLHRSDALADQANRGAKMSAYLKEHGLDKFNSHYKL